MRRVGATHRAIISNASSLVGTTAVTSGLGVVYWWLAARHFSTGAVGTASAAISAMTLLGTVCVLGFGTFLMGELPRRRGTEASLISSALLVTASAAALAGALFAVLAPLVSSGFAQIGGSIGSVCLFAVGVSLTTVTLVLDQALIGLLRGHLQLGRNAVFAVAKLVVIGGLSLVVSSRTGLSIYATWAAGNVVSLLFLAPFAAAHASDWERARPRVQEMRSVGRAALSHHLLNLSLQAPTLGLPLLVTGILSVQTNAVFYISWMMAGIVFVGPLALSIVLYAADAADPTKLEQKVRLTTGLALLIGVGSNVALFLLGRYLLAIFGPAYAREGRVCLSVLGLGVFPLIVKDHFVALMRIRGHVLRAAALTIMGGSLELLLAAAGAKLGGLSGLSIGWAVGLYVESLFMLGTVLRAASLGSVAASIRSRGRGQRERLHVASTAGPGEG